jgi:adenylate kinase family enzyme
MQKPPGTPPASPSRVIFYGVTGSGKSSAARAYAMATGLPEFSADDDVGWLPGWQQPSTEQQRTVAQGIAAQDRWVLDSAYGVWRDLVVPRADLIVGLDYPRWLSLSRLIRRSVRRVVTRQPVCNGNIETLARLFARDSIIVWHFRSFKRKRRVMRELHADPTAPSLMVFRRPSELEAWLEQVAAAGPSPASP